MRKRKRLFGVLLIIAALVIMTLPVSEADAASSASDFVMEGSKLVKYRGTEENVSVPDTVEVIGENAFEGNTRIELVVLPNTVKRVEAYAFWGCDNLDTVVLGRGLKEVGDYSFAGCKGLEQMSIPANVTAIGIQAFGDCVNMTDISIPVETVNIHESAFDGCAKLKIHCREGSIADQYAQTFYEKQKEMAEYEDVPGYNGDAEPVPTPIPTRQPQTTPEPYDTEGDILGTTQVVGNRAVVFIDAADLVTKRATVPEPDFSELSSDLALMGEEIPKYTIVDDGIVADQAYYKSAALGDVVLPDGVREIGQFSFARSALTKIRLPEGVTDICYGAFYHCDLLTEVKLPETVVNVEPKAFEKSGWVENFLADDSAGDFLMSGGVLVAYRGNSSEVEVPDGVRVIAAEAFYRHSEIEKISFPDSLRVIGEGAFEECTGLREAVLNPGLLQIKDRAFRGAINAVISVPETVSAEGLKAFEGVEVSYEGEKPETHYEASAARLSNADYRVYEGEAKEPGVTVKDMPGAFASLEGASERYELTIREREREGMRTSWERVQTEEMPQNMTVYEMSLTDRSGIPLKKLGKQALTVTIPVPETLRGQELRGVTEDRNGQLESAAVERVLLDGQEALCIRTNQLSLFGIYGVGEAKEEPKELTVSVSAMAQNRGTAPEDGRLLLYAKLLVGAALLMTGGILCFAERKKKKIF